MKKKLITLCILIISSLGTILGQGIEFKDITFKEALKTAKKEKKLVFIDIYTSWCGPCKSLAANVFTDLEVGTLFNDNFICIKKDAEKDKDGVQIRADYNVSLYPSLLFINSDGEVVYRLGGGRKVPQFIKDGQKAIELFANYPILKKCDKQFQKGQKDVAFLNKYIDLLMESGRDITQPMLVLLESISDTTLINAKNLERIAKLNDYQPELYKRIQKVVVEQKLDKKQMDVIGAKVALSLSIAMKNVSKKGTEQQFMNLINQKDEVFKTFGLTDNLMAATMGQGNIFIPNAFLIIDYYKIHKLNDKFIPYLKEIMDMLGKTNAKSLEEKRAMLVQYRNATDEQRTKMAFNVNGGNPLMEFMKNSQKSIMGGMVGKYLNYYNEITANKQDKEYIKTMKEWLRTLHLLNPDAKTSIQVATMLKEMNDQSAAREVTEIGICETYKDSKKGIENRDKLKQLLNSL